MPSDFGRNLRALCARERSVSAVCRAIGINRQQFSRYLTGESRPSAHNLRRICSYFEIDDGALDLAHATFREQLCESPSGGPRGRPSDRLLAALRDTFCGDRRPLVRLCGYHHFYFRTPTWPGRLMRGLLWLHERGGLFVTKSVVRAARQHDGARYLSKYLGLAASLHDRVFLIEAQTLSRDALTETVLYPSVRRRSTLIGGVTFGVSDRTGAPYTSPTVYQSLGGVVDLRAALAATGVVDLDFEPINPRVLAMMGEADGGA